MRRSLWIVIGVGIIWILLFTVQSKEKSSESHTIEVLDGVIAWETEWSEWDIASLHNEDIALGIQALCTFLGIYDTFGDAYVCAPNDYWVGYKVLPHEAVRDWWPEYFDEVWIRILSCVWRWNYTETCKLYEREIDCDQSLQCDAIEVSCSVLDNLNNQEYCRFSLAQLENDISICENIRPVSARREGCERMLEVKH